MLRLPIPFKITILLLISLTFLVSKPISYDEIIKKSDSLAKDYYIYRLLNENNNLTEKQAENLYTQVSRMNPKLQKLFYKKITNNETIKKEIRCKNLSALDMVESEDEKCIMMRISPSIVANLDSSNKTKLYNLLDENPYTKSWVKAMNSENVFLELQKTGAKQFLTVFNGSLNKYKKSHLDKTLGQDFIRKLEPLVGFATMIKHIVLADPYLDKIPTSLLYEPSNNSNLTHEAAFFLGINAIKHNDTKIADMFFAQAYNKAYFKSDKDKSLFWRYLTTNDNSMFEELSESFDINIYSLYAKESLGLPISNAYHLNSTNNQTSSYDMQNPFLWMDTLKTIRKSSNEQLLSLSKNFTGSQTLPVYAFIMQRYNQSKKHYYITPYSEYLKKTDTDRQILIYAIARQESLFIPSAVSTSYALGMMQFMPFVAIDIAKKEKVKDFDIDDMFKPKIAYDFANVHLDFLNTNLSHPLFVAYAYNGGIGFTKRLLQTNRYFNKGKYEPFLSIETIPYAESREYGKKVLSNYVIYSYILDKNVSIRNLFEELTQPSKTDKFRHQVSVD